MRLKSKEQIFREVQQLVNQNRAKYLPDGWGGCLLHTFGGMLALQRAGYGRVVIQAGSFSWPILEEKDDDGVAPTHFSYVWSPNELPSVLARVTGALPEIHSWLGIIDTNEIVDFSIGDLRKQAEKMGFKWRTPDPPPYVWGKIPDRVTYEPMREATFYVGDILSQLAREAGMLK